MNAPAPLWLRIAHLGAGRRLLFALLAAGVAALVAPPVTRPLVRALVAWDAFAVLALSLTWLAILTVPPNHIRRIAQEADKYRLIWFGLMILGAIAALLAVTVLLHVEQGLNGPRRLGYALLSLSVVALAWSLLHTLFTLRYAHLYYADPTCEDGLGFPDKPAHPDYRDFAYFAFTIGMAAQTADVTITTPGMRRIVLLHALLAFGFNTALVALSISALGGLL